MCEARALRAFAGYAPHGWYPAFDVTPPRFVTRIVTTHGVFVPDHHLL